MATQNQYRTALFPAPAGMIRREYVAAGDFSTVPRASGDDP